tara:strand:+ start:465 stop:620 length:156 start_codon:yes stop_codon:yes gene_type:complete
VHNYGDTTDCRHGMHDQGQCGVNIWRDEFGTYMHHAKESADGEKQGYERKN